MEFFVSVNFFLVAALAVAVCFLTAKWRKVFLLAVSLAFLVHFGGMTPYQLLFLFGLISAVFLTLAFARRRVYRLFSVIYFGLFLAFIIFKIHYSSSSSVSIVSVFGTSFLFLKLVHFVEDFRVKKIEVPDFFGFINYIVFFPVFASGPVMRYRGFETEYNNPAILNHEVLLDSSMRILKGLLKKIILVGFLYDAVLTPSDAMSSGFFLFSVKTFAYSVMIYLDFSGYSDMSIGLARLFGFKVPENFSYPYLKRNLIEFWNSWHITFSNWLRDYLFMPCGKYLFRTRLKSSPLLIAGTSYMVTFLFCGFWHGGALNFVLWGLYHGLGLWAVKAFIEKSKKWNKSSFGTFFQSRIGTGVSICFTFIFVTVGWIFFVMDMKSLSILLSRIV